MTTETEKQEDKNKNKKEGLFERALQIWFEKHSVGIEHPYAAVLNRTEFEALREIIAEVRNEFAPTVSSTTEMAAKSVEPQASDVVYPKIWGKAKETVMLAIKEHNGLNIREIADKTGLMENTISGLCKQLLNEKKVERSNNQPYVYYETGNNYELKKMLPVGTRVIITDKLVRELPPRTRYTTAIQNTPQQIPDTAASNKTKEEATTVGGSGGEDEEDTAEQQSDEKSAPKKQVQHNWSDASRQRQRTRLLAVRKLCDDLRAQHPTMKKNEAMKKAWKRYKESSNTDEILEHAIQREEPHRADEESEQPEQEKEFPTVYPVAEEANHILADIAKKCVSGKGRIGYFDVRHLKITTTEGRWDGRVWHEFCQQFIQNGQKILEYFDVHRGQFEIEKDPNTNYETIILSEKK